MCSTGIGLVIRGIRVLSFCDLYIRSVSSSMIPTGVLGLLGLSYSVLRVIIRVIYLLGTQTC